MKALNSSQIEQVGLPIVGGWLPDIKGLESIPITGSLAGMIKHHGWKRGYSFRFCGIIFHYGNLPNAQEIKNNIENLFKPTN